MLLLNVRNAEFDQPYADASSEKLTAILPFESSCRAGTYSQQREPVIRRNFRVQELAFPGHLHRNQG